MQFVLPILVACLLGRVAWCVPQLELATVVYRHGDRTPIVTWPTDPYGSESSWPQGYGQLTIRGMAQQFFLGELFYDRYISRTYPGFLNENYTRTQLYIRSTDVDRTLMSAEVQLSALFYPSEGQRFNVTLPWQPIPVHTVPMADDILLRAYDADCPYYSWLVNQSYFTPEYIALEQQNNDLVVLLRNVTGSTALKIEDLWMVEDTLFIENIYNRTPSWYYTALFNRIKSITDYTLTLMFDSVEKNRLSAGVFVGELVAYMNTTVMGMPQSDATKMHMYSVHDTTVAAVMSALGLYNGIQPPYATAFMIELFSENGNFFVKFFFRNDTATTSVQELFIPACGGTNCTWSQFVSFTKKLIPSDWNAECQFPTPTPSITSSPPTTSSQIASSKVAAITLGVLLGFVVLLVVVFFVVAILKSRMPSKSYSIDDETKTPLMTARQSF